MPVVLPYCGSPPSPEALWTRWNFDPVLIAVLILLAGAYALGACRLSRGERGAFYAGWAITAAALISPLCPLSVSLFSARVGQHMVLALIAAPLVAAGRPLVALRALAGRPTSAPGPAAPCLGAGCFAALLWFWHAPVPYAATFTSTGVYWLMHVSVFGAALWLWSGLDRSPAGSLRIVASGLISTVQMGLLGALITFAPRPLYAPHALTTAAWGLTPLQDQQLGGAIMWIPGCVIFLLVSLLSFRALLDGTPRHGPVPLEAR